MFTQKYVPNPPANGVDYTDEEKMNFFRSVVYGGYPFDIVPVQFHDELRSKFFDMLDHPEKYLDPSHFS